MLSQNTMRTALSAAGKLGTKNRSLFAQHAVRTASVTNVRFIQSKPRTEKQVLERYKAKLEARAKQQGLESAERLMEEMKDTIEQTKKQLNAIDPLKELDDYEQAVNLRDSLSGKKKTLDPIQPGTPTKPYKTLESYLVLEKIRELDVQHIEFLWRAKFQGDPQSLVAVVPGDTFDVMYGHARANPTFVLPLPKADAQLDEADRAPADAHTTPMEVHFVQWSFVGPKTTHCMITTLMEYKLHKEYARPHTTLSFHQELEDDKGIVLMSGHVDKDAAITPAESQILLLNLQRFYGAFRTNSDIEHQRVQLVRDFNSGSPGFSMEKCIELSQSLDN